MIILFLKDMLTWYSITMFKLFNKNIKLIKNNNSNMIISKSLMINLDKNQTLIKWIKIML